MVLLEDLVEDRFGIIVARELCKQPGLFEQGKLYRRVVVAETLRDEFVRRGGDEDTSRDAVVRVLKKWLPGPASPFQKETYGRYRFIGSDGATEQALGVDGRSSAGDAPTGGPSAPEREIGAGACEVYAWCLPRYELTSGDRWPIRIGKAGPEGFRRRLSGFQENLPERPRYLLRLGCTDDREARDRESLLHAWFKSRGQKLEGLPGDAWFLTNPNEVVEAVRNIVGTHAAFHGGSALEIEDAIADAFKDVTSDDWARLPEDLAERLDDYLYRSDRM